MSSYTPDEPGMREAYRFHTRQISDHRYIEQGKPVMADAEIEAEFDRFIAKVRAEAWDEGFDAGERDVMEHDTAGWSQPCIPNPYRTDEVK